MRLTVLGSGTSVPNARRSSSGFWLETPHGTMLLDCSPSAIHRMAEESLDWAGLDAIWISHFHLDHSGGLPGFLFGIKHARETANRTKPMILIGPEGFRDWISTIDSASDYGFFSMRFPVEVIEVSEGTKFDPFPGVSAAFFKTPHTPESHAIRVETGGRSIVYSSDTGPDDGLATFARAADLLILECSFIADKPVEKHLELAEAARIIAAAGPGRAVLTHLCPEWDETDLAVEKAKFEFGCEVYEAFDGMRVEIT